MLAILLASAFLSCLCGSDPEYQRLVGVFDFLSCLCGSDQKMLAILLASAFLSCLCGSDLYSK